MASPTAVVIAISSDDEGVQRRRRQQKKPVVVVRNEERSDGGSDDDCFILDRDPDEPIRVQNNGPDDELLIVGERGEIACRDFPHARHLCANFPFDNTSHEKFCSLCHCYICDSPAPCVHWGSGVLHTDHCHANESVELWKILRNSFKRVNTISAPGEQRPKIKRTVAIPTRNPALTQPSFMQSLSPKRIHSPPRYRISYGNKFFRRAPMQPEALPRPQQQTEASDVTHGAHATSDKPPL